MNRNILTIKEWIISLSPEMREFDGDFNLIETGALDSLQFLELINLIEELSGQMVDMAQITVADFLTLNTIENKFFKK
jgi:acyl carrier protein